MVDAASKLGGSASHAICSAPVARDLALDVVKGVLVVVMVVYHAMNIFSKAGPEEYAYVRFVSGSFILMSGYIVAKFHDGQFKADWSNTSRRLIVRGVKLLVLFTLLNVLINVTGIGNPNKAQPDIQRYMSSLFEVYVAGTPGHASFQILLPIAYLLIAAPIFLALARFSAWLFAAGSLTTFAPSLAGVSSVNLDFMLLGAIGLSGGLLVNAVEKPFALRGTWSIAAGLLAAVILMKYLNDNLSTYALGTILILKLLYDLSKAAGTESRLARAAILLGQYSLACYIAQIVFMQMLHLGLLRPRWELGYETVLVILATVGFLLVFSAALAMFRHQRGFVARVYRLIFA